jgi:hypothetical protein
MKGDHILIFSASETTAPSPEIRRGLRETVQAATGEVSEVAVSTLQGNLRGFLHHIDAIIGESPKEVGGLALEQIELHVQIDGKGNVGLLGIAKAEIATQGGIKLVLKKKR